MTKHSNTPLRIERPRGFLLIEAAVVAVLLVITMTIAVRLVGWAAAERRSQERRSCAVREVANLMERLHAEGFDRLSSDRARTLKLSDAVAQTLPGAELEVTVDAEPGPPAAKRIRLQLRWQTRAQTWDAPVTLCAWAFKPGGPK